MPYRARPRRRRPRRASVLLLVALLLTLAVGADADSDPLYVTATVSASTRGGALPAGFLGLSLEYDAIHRYLGRDANHPDRVFEQLVAALAPGADPVIRIGGDSTDHTWWPLPGLIEPAGVSYTLTPNWFETVRHFAATDHARLILGINLAADNPQAASAEARALIDGVGGQYLEALEIGNEPDGYADFAWYRSRTGALGFARGPGWDAADYLGEFSQWASVLPDVPLAGPAFAYTDWMTQLPALLAQNPRLGVVTLHRYPLRACGAGDSGALAATIPNLLADSSSAGLAASVAPYVAEIHAAGLPFRIDELNSASCGGAPGVSNTFASALWMLDTLFNMAAVGVDGVNVHTLPGAAYAPFSFTRHGGVWEATVNPVYYGMLMFSQAFPAGAKLLATHSNNDAVKVWSTRDPHGTVRTVVINESPDDPAIVRLTPPQLARAPASVETLAAPSLTATTGVSLGGESFAPDTTTGVLGAPRTTSVAPSLGSYELTVAPASAVLVTGG